MSPPPTAAAQRELPADPTPTDASPQTTRPPLALFVALFVLSGAAGLIDQLCFSKYLTYVVGSTAYAVSAVLAAFMTGLALGAHFGGKYATRLGPPLRAYGILELVVAAAIALGPLGFDALTSLYVALAKLTPGSVVATTMVRWLLAMVLVVVPTTAMGATLPILSRALREGPGASGVDRRLGALYAANTLGGAIGALGSAYLVLPLLGLRATLWASAAVSASVGLLALWAHRRATSSAVSSSARNGAASDARELRGHSDARELRGHSDARELRGHSDARELRGPRENGQSGIRLHEPRPAPSATSIERGGILVALAAASGALVFACEVVFTHLLALVIGNSAYAFGLILAAFLSWLFVGATVASRLSAASASRALVLGLAAAGLSLTAVVPLWDQLPLLFAGQGTYVTTFAAREAVRAAVAFIVLCVPVTAMGLTFPLLLRRVADQAAIGHWVGRLTAVNTLGAVLGCLLTGYVVLPWLGSQRTVLGVALAFVAASLLALRLESTPRHTRTIALSISAATLAVVAVLPRWNVNALTSGNNVYFDTPEKPNTVIMMREDIHGGVTTVTRATDGVLTLYTNGKFQGNNGWEMNAQRYFAHYPCLFVKQFERSLVIGLGTGTTLGTLTAYPWKTLDLVEISPSILEAARTYFSGPNRNALNDPRVNVFLEDGRNHLLVHDAAYDLIGIELSSIWFAGASNLYSREFYELVRSRLRPGGVLQQWVQLHHIERRPFATILHSLRAVFPHVTLFQGGGQGILVASMNPLSVSKQQIAAIEQRPEIRETIPRSRPLLNLLDDVLVTTEGLDAFVNQVARDYETTPDRLISTDDNLYLEYATPRGNVLPWSTRDQLIAELLTYRKPAAIDAWLVR